MKWLLCAVLMGVAKIGAAQTLAEWTQQKKTQIAYLLNQVAALQMYIGFAQEGYGIYRDGLQLVGDIESGEFDLHKNYFASLTNVNRHLRELPELEEARQWLEQIHEWKNKIVHYDLGVANASAKRLFDELVSCGSEYVQEIQSLVTDGLYQQKDEERLTRISTVYIQMKELYAFARTQYNEVLMLAQQRIHEANEAKRMRKLTR